MIYVWHHTVALVLAIGTGYGLTGARWPHRSPRLGLLLWLATAFCVLTGVSGLLLSAGLAPYRRGILPALGRLASGGLAPGLTPAHLTAVGAGLLLITVMAAVAMRSSWGVHRERARHRLLLDLVARRDARNEVLILDHPVAAVYFLPGRPGCVVVSSGAWDALTDGELAAVLAHERAHAAARHHLVLAPFQALCRALPCPATLRAAGCVELLVEMCADDHAARDRGSAQLSAALRRFRELSPRPAPRGALGADHALTLRLQRLRSARRPLPRQHRWWIIGAALTVATTPASLFVWPLG